MPTELAADLAASSNGLVVAPAGYGKTRLIVEAVKRCAQRQLILTHTHAGVEAILRDLRLQGVSPNLFRVATIDGFALRYAASYPILSGWRTQQPSGIEWQQVTGSAALAFGNEAVTHVLRQSYAGIFIDEYQDCTIDQHRLLRSLMQVLPCRALGDPLQAVFAEINGEMHLPWNTVERDLSLVGELEVGHRWLPHNPALGEWLKEVRVRLETGSVLDLTDSAVRCILSSSHADRRRACSSVSALGLVPVVALFKHRTQAHKMSKLLGNRFRTLEDVEGKDLLKGAESIGNTFGADRVNALGEFVKKWSVPPSQFDSLVNAVCKNRVPRLRSWCPGNRDIYDALCKVRDNNDLAHVNATLGLLEDLKPTFASRETWKDMRRALQNATGSNAGALRESAWRIRDVHRHVGRRVPKHCLSTPLLVKGLQFQACLLVDVDYFDTAESLYVALTRGSYSLTVVSSAHNTQRPLPLFKSSGVRVTD